MSQKDDPFELFINNELGEVDNLPNPNPEKIGKEEGGIKPAKKDGDEDEINYTAHLLTVTNRVSQFCPDAETIKFMLRIIKEARVSLPSALPQASLIHYIDAALIWAAHYEQKTSIGKMEKAFLLGMIFQRIISEGWPEANTPKSGGNDPTATT